MSVLDLNRPVKVYLTLGSRHSSRKFGIGQLPRYSSSGLAAKDFYLFARLFYLEQLSDSNVKVRINNLSIINLWV